jgi:hypothetical protein
MQSTECSKSSRTAHSRTLFKVPGDYNEAAPQPVSVRPGARDTSRPTPTPGSGQALPDGAGRSQELSLGDHHARPLRSVENRQPAAVLL